MGGGAVNRALLAASAVEAFLLLMLLGYGPLYLHQAFHAPDVVASLGSAGPALATFVGSTLWGQRLRRAGIGAVARIGLAAYLATGLVAFFAPNAWVYIAGVTLATIFSSALAPATLTFLTYEGGSMGGRLAARLRWQSSGWMVGGLAGGYVQSLSPRAFPLILVILALLMTIPLIAMRSAPDIMLQPADTTGGHPSQLGLIVLLVLPFFFAYAGNEGFFTNFGLYLHGLHVRTAWVGWSASISTALGRGPGPQNRPLGGSVWRAPTVNWRIARLYGDVPHHVPGRFAGGGHCRIFPAALPSLEHQHSARGG